MPFGKTCGNGRMRLPEAGATIPRKKHPCEAAGRRFHPPKQPPVEGVTAPRAGGRAARWHLATGEVSLGELRSCRQARLSCPELSSGALADLSFHPVCPKAGWRAAAPPFSKYASDVAFLDRFGKTLKQRQQLVKEGEHVRPDCFSSRVLSPGLSLSTSTWKKVVVR